MATDYLEYRRCVACGRFVSKMIWTEDRAKQDERRMQHDYNIPTVIRIVFNAHEMLTDGSA